MFGLWLAYCKRFVYCRRSLGPGRSRFRGKMVHACLSPWLLDRIQQPAVPDTTEVEDLPSVSSSSEAPVVSIDAVNFNQWSTDFVLKGLGAASMLSAPLSDESIIFLFSDGRDLLSTSSHCLPHSKVSEAIICHSSGS